MAESRSLVIPSGQTAAALAPLPIEALRLAPETIDWLHELGLVQIRQLEPIERSGIASRFGPELLRRWDQALGQAAETIVAYRPPAEFEAAWSFEFPTESLEVLEAALAELLHKLIAQLLPRNDGIQQLACRLRGESGNDVSFRVGLFAPALMRVIYWSWCNYAWNACGFPSLLPEYTWLCWPRVAWRCSSKNCSPAKIVAAIHALWHCWSIG